MSLAAESALMRPRETKWQTRTSCNPSWKQGFRRLPTEQDEEMPARGRRAIRFAPASCLTLSLHLALRQIRGNVIHTKHETRSALALAGLGVLRPQRKQTRDSSFLERGPYRGPHCGTSQHREVVNERGTACVTCSFLAKLGSRCIRARSERAKIPRVRGRAGLVLKYVVHLKWETVLEIRFTYGNVYK